MRKIVILKDQSEPARNFISLLRRIFPECEIRIVTKEEYIKALDLPDCSQNSLREKDHGEHLDN